MGIHADLVAVAEGLAAAARQELTGTPTGVGEIEAVSTKRAMELSTAAKTALEAAALAQDIGPGEIDAALGEIQDELEAAGVLAESVELEPAVFLKRTLAAVVHWRRETEAAGGLLAAYVDLYSLLTDLERDFIAGNTETSRRIAARIRTRLDEADQKFKTTTEGD